MPIIKVRKKPGKYFQMAKATVEDVRLSWKAKGLLAYLMSKPSDWEIWTRDLVKRSTDGRTAVLSGLNELIQFGYATREQIKKDDGTFGPVELIVYEVPQSGFPLTGKPLTGKPLTENLTYTKNDCTNNDYTKNEKQQQLQKLDINFSTALKEYQNTFGPLGSQHLYAKFQMLWDEYPKLETHKYARKEMYQAMMREEGHVRPNLGYYAQCLATGSARDQGKRQKRQSGARQLSGRTHAMADPNDPDIKAWLEKRRQSG